MGGGVRALGSKIIVWSSPKMDKASCIVGCESLMMEIFKWRLNDHAGSVREESHVLGSS